jgi:hypothetical protein
MTIADSPLPVLAILAISMLLLLLADLFKNIEPDWRSSMVAPAVCGLIAGALTLAARRAVADLAAVLLAGLVLTLIAAYLQRIGLHSEPIEGLMAGAVTGTSAALIAVPLTDRSPSLEAAGLVLGGSIAGMIYALLQERLTRYLVPANLVTWAASAGGLYVMRHVPPSVPPSRVVLGMAFAVPLAIVLSVFVNRRAAIRELREESALGIFPDEEIRKATHPIRRLFSGGWSDRAVRRRFVSLTNALATRKARQRVARRELARLYQLDVLKLRMELQEILRVQHSIAFAAGDGEPRADTMRNVSS